MDVKQLLTSAEAAKVAGVTPRRLIRWITEGLRDGQIKLGGIKNGGRWMTTRAAIESFQQACTAGVLQNAPPPKDPESSSTEWAIQTLARFGLTVGTAINDSPQR